MLGVTRQRKGMLVLAVALLALGATALGLASGHYRLEWLYMVARICFPSAFLIGAFFGISALKTRLTRWLAIAGFALVALGVAFGALVAHYSDLTGPREVTSVVSSPDGRYELVVESYSVLIDPAYDVWLRETKGVFARKVRVWTSREGPAPSRVAFVGPYELEVASSSTDVRRSTFDPVTLRPSEFHCLGQWCKYEARSE